MQAINVIEWFLDTASKHADKTAVIEGDKRISFMQLRCQSAVLASRIIAQDDILNRPVAVYLPKSINSVLADMAVTFSGNTFMNLDVKAPVERIHNILKQAEPAVLITESRYMETLQPVLPDSIKVVLMENLDAFDKKQEDILLALLAERLANLIDTDPYCIINTSGSTGTPKSVVLNHKSFIDYTEWTIDTLEFGMDEIIGSMSSVFFDAYVHEVIMMMARSATIVIMPEQAAAFPIKIIEIMKKENVSYIYWVPTIMVNIANLDLLKGMDLPFLKTACFAGEVLPTKQYNYWHRHLPGTKIVNLYGPIEITMICSYYIVDREFEDGEPLPIGFPCRNTSVLILNENNRQCKANEEGELCVRGTSLAMGYYNNGEKTSAAFTQNPLNTKYPELIYRTGDIVTQNSRGEIMFRGRRDTLIKHSGYRIELGEIEHIVVNTLHLVANGCVVYHQQNREITLIYEAPDDIPAAEFRKRIGQSLPKYMIPTKYVRVEKMPMNSNGKIDRLALNKQINSAPPPPTRA
jgi:amino acid adenylation domain-containing protein